jgi:hypothetical protein
MRRLLIALFAALLAACAQNPPAAKPEPPPAVPRVATVGHVAEVRTRGVNHTNLWGSITDLYRNEAGRNVLDTSWEVTVFYEDHTQGTVSLPQRPDLRPGQRVIVTGNKIEPAPR